MYRTVDVPLTNQLSSIYQDHSYASLPDFSPLLYDGDTHAATESEEFPIFESDHTLCIGDGKVLSGATNLESDDPSADDHINILMKREPDSPDGSTYFEMDNSQGDDFSADDVKKKPKPDSPDDEWWARLQEFQDTNIIPDTWDYQVMPLSCFFK